MSATRITTIEDLASIDGVERHEIVRGELVTMPPSNFEHSDIALAIAAALRLHVMSHGLGRVVGENAGFVLQRNPDTLLAPDAAYVSADRLPPADERERFLALVPDLVVEVVSPNDRARDIEEKVQLYLGAGVRVALVVYPRLRHIRSFSHDGSSRLYRDDDILDLDPVVPGFSLPVADVFV